MTRGSASALMGNPSSVAICVAATLMMAGWPAHAAFPLTDLSAFYVTYRDPRSTLCDAAFFEPGQAEVVIVGGAEEPPNFPVHASCESKSYRTVHRLVNVTRDNAFNFAESLDASTKISYGPQRWFEPCGGTRVLIRKSGLPDPAQFASGDQREFWNGDAPLSNKPIIVSGSRCNEDRLGDLPAPKFIIKSDYSPQPPVRRRAVDGSEYDASPLVIKRQGVPWYTHYWAYRMGLVASESNFNDADRDKLPSGWNLFSSPAYNFELAKLPSPRVEEDVIEYVNRADFPNQPGGQYFYVVLASDKTLLDSIPAWQRSGKSFKSGGYVSACRFYGGKNGGPNTHFYSADDKECTALKAIALLSYEGQTFAVNVPLPGANADGSKPCPIDSKALHRVYNNASASNGRFVSNHRYLTEKADVATVVAQGWVDEGQVMCVPN